MRARPLIGLVLALSCTGVATAPTASPTPLGTPAATVAPSAAPSPTPSVTPEPTSMRLVAAGAIPRRFRYAVIQWEVTRIWLVDLDGRDPPRLVIRLQNMGGGEHTVSSDGTVVVLSAPGSQSVRAVHVVRPATGTSEIVHDEAGTQVGGTPIVTRDGSRYAFAKQAAGVSGAPGGSPDHGIWVGSTGGGAATALVGGGGAAGPRPIEWSPDGRWLAFARGGTIFIASPGLPERRVADGVDASWLSSTALLIARAPSASPGVDRYDVATTRITPHAQASASVVDVLADPTGARYAYEERRGGQGAFIGSGPVWLVEASGAARRLVEQTSLYALEWSSDGSALTGIVGGDDSSTGVGDLLGGAGVRLCKRADGLPPPPPSGCV